MHPKRQNKRAGSRLFITENNQDVLTQSTRDARLFGRSLITSAVLRKITPYAKYPPTIRYLFTVFINANDAL